MVILSSEHIEVASPWEKRVITLIHRYGEKISLFVKSYTTPLFELMNIEPRSSSKENSVAIEV
jgi:hypothetical protein